MVSEEEIKARVERMAEAYKVAVTRAPMSATVDGMHQFAIEPITREMVRLEEALTAQTRARQEAESAAAQARKEAATFEQAALQTEKERTHVEALLRAEIQELRRTVHLLRAAHVTNLRVYLATVEGQS